MDSIYKGRWQIHGKYSYRHHITPPEVLFIRKSNLKRIELAKKFGVAHSTISDIVRGKIHAWVKDTKGDQNA